VSLLATPVRLLDPAAGISLRNTTHDGVGTDTLGGRTQRGELVGARLEDVDRALVPIGILSPIVRRIAVGEILQKSLAVPHDSAPGRGAFRIVRGERDPEAPISVRDDLPLLALLGAVRGGSCGVPNPDQVGSAARRCLLLATTTAGEPGEQGDRSGEEIPAHAPRGADGPGHECP